MHHIPKLSAPDESMRMGETTLAQGLGLPLSFGHAYLTLLVCLCGSAHFTLNFKEHAVRRGGVMLLAEDTIALLKRRSRRFKVFFCLTVRVKVPVALVLLRLTHCALNFRAFWVQIHRICQLPVACPGTPAARISFSGIFI